MKTPKRLFRKRPDRDEAKLTAAIAKVMPSHTPLERAMAVVKMEEAAKHPCINCGVNAGGVFRLEVSTDELKDVYGITLPDSTFGGNSVFLPLCQSCNEMCERDDEIKEDMMDAIMEIFVDQLRNGLQPDF